MPAYEYTCTGCQIRETLIAGIDDHAVSCKFCGQKMERREDVASLLASYEPSVKPAVPAQV
jgi:putative FmdB family regulatory protein